MTQPRHFGPMEGVTYQLGRITMAFKRGADDAPGASDVHEQILPVGAGAGLHRHPSYDETFVVIEGRFDFVVDGAPRTAAAGELVVVPRGTPHSLTSIGPDPGRLLIVGTPGGHFERFIAEICAAQVDPGGGSARPAIDFRAIAARHGIEFID